MNKIILMGRLVKDPEMRTVNGGPNGSFQVTRFTLAVDRPKSKGQKQSEADFINCEASGTRGENIVKYLGKGRKILIYGNWRTGSYTSQTGAKVYTNICNVQEWEFADSNPSQNGNQQGGYRNQQQIGSDNDGFLPDGLDDELPFN